VITLRPAPHTATEDTVVEVWDDQRMVAAIYPTVRGVKIISKHLDGRMSVLSHVEYDPAPPASIHIHVLPEPAS
jgi:hypothetical protein